MRSRQTVKQHRTVVLLIALLGAAGVWIQATHAGSSVFFECSNSTSPVMSGRSDLIGKDCDGEVVQKPLTLENLMRGIENTRKALRAITVSRSGELSGAADLSQKMLCYAESIRFAVQSAKQFPPKRNVDKREQYESLFDELNVNLQKMQSVIEKGSSEAGAKEEMVVGYTRFAGTCQSCHANFR